MKILIAPDSFKGSVSSVQAAERIRIGLERQAPAHLQLEIDTVPVADGGEGTVDAYVTTVGGKKVAVTVEDPLGRNVHAVYAWHTETKTAVIETAAASGLPLLTEAERDPAHASTYGTGQLVEHARQNGAETIVIGLGGSATVDAGVGFLQALGVRFYDEHDQLLDRIGGRLRQINRIDSSELEAKWKHVQFIVASDVQNPLLGEEGAIHIFGPQKGVRSNQLDDYETGMAHFAHLVRKQVRIDYSRSAGAGAAGGFGFTLQSFFTAHLRSGFEWICEEGNLENRIAAADLVITGEGSLDSQSLFGKVPVSIGEIAMQHATPVIAVAGRIEGELATFRKHGITCTWPIVDEPMTLKEAMKNGEMLLQNAGERIMEAMIGLPTIPET